MFHTLIANARFEVKGNPVAFRAGGGYTGGEIGNHRTAGKGLWSSAKTTGEAGTGLLTAKGRDFPTVRQYNVFLENRLGAMMNVVRRFEATDVRIVSLTVVDSADCAIIRMVLSDSERAVEIFRGAKMMFTESELVVVKLPDSTQPLVEICKALLSVELSIHYAYPLMLGVGYDGGTALALHVADTETAVQTLQEKGFTLYTEGDLKY